MHLSRYFLPILRETPKEAEIVSHRLMLRAGMIRQAAAGIYAFLPLGLRVLRKVCAIVREEQDRAGAVELLMPTIQSAELWRASGRYDVYGKEMLRIQDRHERDMLYGPVMDLAHDGARRMVWVGEPNVGNAKVQATLQTTNSLAKEEAAKRPWVTYFDLASLVAGPDGGFAEIRHLPRRGGRAVLRGRCGPHEPGVPRPFDGITAPGDPAALLRRPRRFHDRPGLDVVDHGRTPRGLNRHHVPISGWAVRSRSS